MGWQPSLGAWPAADGVHFRVWAPEAHDLQLLIESRDGCTAIHCPVRQPDGTFSLTVSAAHSGDYYAYRIDGRGPFPDPASRFQPEGVHGPSMIVDPTAFRWHDRTWKGVTAAQLIFYELHVGTFTPEGTFVALIARLPELVALGITAIELMPIADFAGQRNW